MNEYERYKRILNNPHLSPVQYGVKQVAGGWSVSECNLITSTSRVIAVFVNMTEARAYALMLKQERDRDAAKATRH